MKTVILKPKQLECVGSVCCFEDLFFHYFAFPKDTFFYFTFIFTKHFISQNEISNLRDSMVKYNTCIISTELSILICYLVLNFGVIKFKPSFCYINHRFIFLFFVDNSKLISPLKMLSHYNPHIPLFKLQNILLKYYKIKLLK